MRGLNLDNVEVIVMLEIHDYKEIKEQICLEKHRVKITERGTVYTLIRKIVMVLKAVVIFRLKSLEISRSITLLATRKKNKKVKLATQRCVNVLLI
jgi:hypothetical protein